MRSQKYDENMGRPSKPEKRDQQLNLKFTCRELQGLRTRAAASSMRLVDFARAQLLMTRPARIRKPGEPPQVDPLFIAQVSRIGNNLNQIARRLNTLDILPPPTLQPLLEAIRDIIRRGTGRGA